MTGEAHEVAFGFVGETFVEGETELEIEPGCVWDGVVGGVDEGVESGVVAAGVFGDGPVVAEGGAVEGHAGDDDGGGAGGFGGGSGSGRWSWFGLLVVGDGVGDVGG